MQTAGLRLTFEEFSHELEQMSQEEFWEHLQDLARFEHEMPKETDRKQIADRAMQILIREMEPVRPLDHPPMEFYRCLETFTNGLIFPSAMNYLIHIVCRKLVAGEGDLLDDLKRELESLAKLG